MITTAKCVCVRRSVYLFMTANVNHMLKLAIVHVKIVRSILKTTNNRINCHQTFNCFAIFF